jgi:hypothetical protein
MMAFIVRERETFKAEIAAVKCKARYDVETARRYAGEEALNRIIEKSFANGDRDLFYRGVMSALDDARYDVGVEFGERASKELLAIDPAIQTRKLITESLISQAALSIKFDTMAYPEHMVHLVRITIPSIERSFAI